jgi:hypothetical protein
MTHFQYIDRGRKGLKYQLKVVFESVMEIIEDTEKVKKSLMTRKELTKYI